MSGDRGSLYSQVQGIMGNGPMGTHVDRQNDRHTRLKILPFRNSVGGR